MKMSQIYPKPKLKITKKAKYTIFGRSSNIIQCNIRLIICYLHQYFGYASSPMVTTIDVYVLYRITKASNVFLTYAIVTNKH